ncbi:protein kinase [Sorangium cellulosum]|uniref:Protein kinase n=1 Tax=Sorangium cellulosum TaxID=56 RepID=A0A2L0EY79_SORCE|nr:serine/threonine-protein kinase [Sorangium cellulosum]AUX44252.1 protein kinase [Sorangium cellulosum]
MRPGVLVDDRFQILSLAGSGGMGTVYKSLDRHTGKPIALKVLRDPKQDPSRFLLESRVLSTLAHPHIVPYVTDGVGPRGEPYIAMAWIDGESLEARLAGERLSIPETLQLARGVASALSAAHAQGVVHRDLKPSNLMLPVGATPAAVMVVDFGIARFSDSVTTLTRSGAIVGTPGYMAPEQARGDRDLGPQVDIFSLGCVLFECLTGRPAFQGNHLMALLAKLLLEDPPSLVELRPDVPAALAALIGQMMSKEPAGRPADGAALAAALDALDTTAPPPSSRAAPPPTLTSAEQRLVAIVAVGPMRPATVLTTGATALAPGVSPALLAAVRRAAAPSGARVEALADGPVIAVLASAGNATDQAAQAARCALQVKFFMPAAPVALVMGRSEIAGRLPLGEALERAVMLLHPGTDAGDGAAGAVVVDELTRALLEPRFLLAEQDGRIALLGEDLLGESPRLLLGRPTPFVGRERLLAHLISMIEESIAEPRATAILVTAPAGVGKTRLRQELVRALRGRRPGLSISLGRGDVVGAGSAFSMLASVFRGMLALEAGAPIEVQRQRLAETVGMFVADDGAQRVAELLGEVVGAPFSGERSPRLRAARQDPKLMAEAIEAAVLDFTAGVVRRTPTLLLLEDLHWGDEASVRLWCSTLRELADSPFVLVAFARPEVHEKFPRLWAELHVHEIRLPPLSRRAGGELARAVLGDAASAEQIDAIVERSGGNTFYLEELTRALAEGQGEGLPETVLGMVEARLARLDPDVRRVLRAASVFGDVFWKSGVLALLGGAGDAPAGEGPFGYLVERELIMASEKRRFAGEEELAFRHAIVREAAYATLTPRDRALGHRLAAEWLERAGETSAAVLAEHFERGGEGARAARYLAEAAEQALRGGDSGAALAIAERGLASGAEGDAAAALWALRSEAAYWSGGGCELALEAAREALARAAPGTSVSCRALLGAISVAHVMQRGEALRDLAGRLLRVEPTGENVVVLAQAFVQMMVSSVVDGGRVEAEVVHLRMQEACGPFAAAQPAVTACLEQARGVWARWVEHDAWGALRADRAATRHFEQLGYRPFQLLGAAFVGFSLWQLGAFEEAERHLGAVLARSELATAQRRGEPGGLSPPALMARNYLALLHLARAAPAAAEACARETLAACAQQGQALLGKLAHLVLIEALVERGEVEAAAEELARDRPQGPSSRYIEGWTGTLEALLLLRRGRAAEAAGAAEAALAIARGAGLFWPRHALAVVTHIEALLALGDAEGARTALRRARDELGERAGRIGDPAYRRTFLEAVPENTRVIELARRWLAGEAEPGGLCGSGGIAAPAA